MPPKRKSSSTASAGKRKKKAPAEDWRTPLFYWRGTIDGSSWSGTWVASSDGLPSDAEFAASANAFKLEGSQSLATLHKARKGLADAVRCAGCK